MDTSIALRLVLAAALGGGVGIERQIRDKPAGLRTNMLVCVGATLFMLISTRLAAATGGDQTRIAAQIITGIGFLGAGAVLHSRGFVVGLTTAATIWVVAGIGMAVGSGYYGMAALATVLSIVTLTLMGYVEEKLHSHPLHSYSLIVTNLGNALKSINEALKSLSVPPANFSFRKSAGHAQVWFNLTVSLKIHQNIIEKLSEIGDITQVETGSFARDFIQTLSPIASDGEHVD